MPARPPVAPLARPPLHTATACHLLHAQSQHALTQRAWTDWVGHSKRRFKGTADASTLRAAPLQASKCVPLVGSAPAPAGGTLALPPACVVASSDFLSRMQPNGHGDKFRTKERSATGTGMRSIPSDPGCCWRRSGGLCTAAPWQGGRAGPTARACAAARACALQHPGREDELA